MSCFCFSINEFTIASNFVKDTIDLTDYYKRPEADGIMGKKDYLTERFCCLCSYKTTHGENTGEEMIPLYQPEELMHLKFKNCQISSCFS